MVDREESEREDRDILIKTTEELKCSLTEKQLEDMHTRVPMLLADGIDECGPPPHVCESVSVSVSVEVQTIASSCVLP